MPHQVDVTRLLTYSSVEDGQGAVREAHQHTALHVSVWETCSWKPPVAHPKGQPSFLQMYLHDAEHRVLQLDGMETPPPLSHRGVDINAATRSSPGSVKTSAVCTKSCTNTQKLSHHPFWAPSHIVGRTLLIFWASSSIRSCCSALGFELTPSFSRSLSLHIRAELYLLITTRLGEYIFISRYIHSTNKRKSEALLVIRLAKYYITFCRRANGKTCSANQRWRHGVHCNAAIIYL